jgi:replicative DNA helicase
MALTPAQIREQLGAKPEPPANTPPVRVSPEEPKSDVQAAPANGSVSTAEGSQEPFHVEHRESTSRRRPSSESTVNNPHRAPPHSVEAEQGVLGSMLMSPREVIGEVVEKAGADYFYIPAHQTIYSELVSLWDAGAAIDLITFTQVLRDKNLLETVGGAAAVTALYTFVPTAANVGYYLEILRDKYIARSLIAAGTETVRRAYEEQDEIKVLLDETEQTFISLGDDRFSGQLSSMKDNVMRAIEIIEEANKRKGGLVGLATGFTEFDRMTGGLRPAEMVVIAARPSMGKTSLVMNIAEHVSINEKLAVGVFSLEMSTDQLTQRLLCSRARVNLQKIRDGFMSERDFPALTAAAAKLAEAKLLIDDSSSLSILELRAKARRLKSQHDIQLVVVDYLQLLHSTSKKSNDNRQIEVSEISKGLKSLAKELRIPVIVAAQLNRQPEARHGGKPRLSDLRESGSIEQDADLVGLLLRPEIYEEDEEVRQEMAGEAELIIAKQRNGPIGDVALTFLKEFTRFEDRARNINDEDQQPI